MKSVLVVGGHGFLGRAVVAELNRIGAAHKVATRRPQFSTDIEVNFSETRRGLKDFDFAEFSHIVNCAGSTSGSFDQLYEANVEVPKRLMSCLANIEGAPKLTLIGSAAEIGPGHSEPIDETVRLKPISDYGRTKAMMTELMLDFASGGLNVNAARVFNVEGDFLDQNSLMGAIRTQLADQSDVQLKTVTIGNLDAIRDYLPTHVVAELILAVAFQGKSGEIYNVCSGKGTSVRQMVEEKFNQAHKPPVIFREVQTNRSSKSGGVMYSVGNPSKIKSLLERI